MRCFSNLFFWFHYSLLYYPFDPLGIMHNSNWPLIFFNHVATESQDDTLEEDEGETNPYYLPEAFGVNRSSKPAQKKKKHFRSYGQKSYDLGRGSPFMQSQERAIGCQPSLLSGKRPTSSINVSIPTKRVRTASRPRFNGPSGFILAPNRPDASSGDNNSFQDDQSSLHGGSHTSNNMEVESAGEYEKQSDFDLTEVSNRPRKKKKIKHPVCKYLV